MIKSLIRFYRFFLSPVMGNQCRFYPTCSHYSEEAYEKHGITKGSVLTIIRIFKCNPWNNSDNIDVVPKRFAYKDLFRYKHHNKKPKHKA